MSPNSIMLQAQVIVYNAKKANKPDSVIELSQAIESANYAKEIDCDASFDFAIELIKSEIEDYKFNEVK